MRFISEPVLDRIISYTGAYLAGLLLFALVYASRGGGDNDLLNAIILNFSPLALISIPAAFLVARKKGLL